MATALDLTFRVGDKVKFEYGLSAEIVHLYDDGDDSIATVRWKHGPRYDDYTQSEIPLRNLRFACHNHGAPFERIVLDEAVAFDDGYHSGLAFGLTDQFYQAGGPGGIKMAANKINPCRHYEQHDEFDERNNKAWRKGWAAGQKDARMKKPLDFTKPLRTVRDHKPVSYVGPVHENYAVLIPAESCVVTTIDQFGSMGRFHYEIVVENVPEPVTTIIRFRPDGVCLGADYKGPTTPKDILVTVTVDEGLVTRLEHNR